MVIRSFIAVAALILLTFLVTQSKLPTRLPTPHPLGVDR